MGFVANYTGEKQRGGHWNLRAHAFQSSLDCAACCFELAFIKHQLHAGIPTAVLRGEHSSFWETGAPGGVVDGGSFVPITWWPLAKPFFLFPGFC